MTTIQALLIFLGIPLAVVGAIFAAVYAAAPRGRPVDPPGAPVGTALAPHPCEVETDGGSERHEPATSDDERPRCWTLACAECRAPYREGRDDVHFTSSENAVGVACVRGWVLAGHRMRCQNCA